MKQIPDIMNFTKRTNVLNAETDETKVERCQFRTYYLRL